MAGPAKMNCMDSANLAGAGLSLVVRTRSPFGLQRAYNQTRGAAVQTDGKPNSIPQPATNFAHRIIQPVLNLLRQGMTPEKVALTIALGVTLGVTPIFGLASILCFLAAILLRLNGPAIQLVN